MKRTDDSNKLIFKSERLSLSDLWGYDATALPTLSFGYILKVLLFALNNIYFGERCKHLSPSMCTSIRCMFRINQDI